MSAAITRACAAGATRFVIPTAGNAGVALAAYASRAGVEARVYAPATTPATILQQIRFFGGDLQLVDGHIGDCGRLSAEWSASTGAFNVSTLREPYRIEGKKTLGLELAVQLGWSFPDAIIYPTGGGTGLIGSSSHRTPPGSRPPTACVGICYPAATPSRLAPRPGPSPRILDHGPPARRNSNADPSHSAAKAPFKPKTGPMPGWNGGWGELGSTSRSCPPAFQITSAIAGTNI